MFDKKARAGGWAREQQQNRGLCAWDAYVQPLDSPAASCMVMNPEPDEYGLALRAREGDPDALAELVARTRLRLFSLAYAELRHYDDAHDAVASALLQICRHIKELREPERVRAWMRSIVRNEARRLRR